MNAIVAARRFLPWTGLFLAGVYIVLLAVKDPAAGSFPSCPFRNLTGWSCPGCGSQRAIHELLHLHVAEAFNFNALLVVGLPVLLAQWLFGSRVKNVSGLWMPRGGMIAWMVALVTWGILRNVQGW